MRDWEAVAERLANEELLRPAAAARLVPRCKGESVSPSTILRWILSGKSGVKLDGIRANGRGWWTSREALQRFWAALSERGAPTQPVIETPPQRTRREEEDYRRSEELLRLARKKG